MLHSLQANLMEGNSDCKQCEVDNRGWLSRWLFVYLLHTNAKSMALLCILMGFLVDLDKLLKCLHSIKWVGTTLFLCENQGTAFLEKEDNCWVQQTTNIHKFRQIHKAIIFWWAPGQFSLDLVEKEFYIPNSWVLFRTLLPPYTMSVHIATGGKSLPNPLFVNCWSWWFLSWSKLYRRHDQ